MSTLYERLFKLGYKINLNDILQNTLLTDLGQYIQLETNTKYPDRKFPKKSIGKGKQWMIKARSYPDELYTEFIDDKIRDFINDNNAFNEQTKQFSYNRVIKGKYAREETRKAKYAAILAQSIGEQKETENREQPHAESQSVCPNSPLESDSQSARLDFSNVQKISEKDINSETFKTDEHSEKGSSSTTIETKTCNIQFITNGILKINLHSAKPPIRQSGYRGKRPSYNAKLGDFVNPTNTSIDSKYSTPRPRPKFNPNTASRANNYSKYNSWTAPRANNRSKFNPNTAPRSNYRSKFNPNTTPRANNRSNFNPETEYGPTSQNTNIPSLKTDSTV